MANFMGCLLLLVERGADLLVFLLAILQKNLTLNDMPVEHSCIVDDLALLYVKGVFTPALDSLWAHSGCNKVCELL